MPDALGYLWGFWQELDRERGANGMGISAITSPQIESWARMTDRVLEPHEASALVTIDVTMRSTWASESAKERKAK